MVNSGRWTAAEDALLRAAVKKYGTSDWRLVAANGPENRTNTQCLQRWSRSLKPGLKKGKWTAAEDALLAKLATEAGAVTKDSAVRWPALAKHIEGRTSKQCRERWFMHISPSVNTAPFGAEDDATLIKLYNEKGSSWTEIANNFEGRTADHVKVRIRSLLRQENQKIVVGQSKRSREDAEESLHGLEQWLQQGGPSGKSPGQRSSKIMKLDNLLAGTEEFDSLFVRDIEMLLEDAESGESPAMQEQVKGWAQFVLGHNNFYNHRPLAAEKSIQNALAIAQSIQDSHLEGWSYFKLSLIHHGMQKSAQAFAYASKSLHIARQLGHVGLQKWAHIVSGFAHLLAGDYEKALCQASASLMLNTKTNCEVGGELSLPDDKISSWAHQILAGVYNGQGSFNLALAHAQHSLEFARRKDCLVNRRAVGWGHYAIMHSQLGLATLASRRGDRRERERCLREGRAARNLAMESAESTREVNLKALLDAIGEVDFSFEFKPEQTEQRGREQGQDAHAQEDEQDEQACSPDPSHILKSSFNTVMARLSPTLRSPCSSPRSIGLIGVDTTGDGLVDSRMTVEQAIQHEAQTLARQQESQQHAEEHQCLSVTANAKQIMQLTAILENMSVAEKQDREHAAPSCKQLPFLETLLDGLDGLDGDWDMGLNDIDADTSFSSHVDVPASSAHSPRFLPISAV